MEFKIYSKKNCVACEQAKALLEAKGIGYEVVDVMTTPTAQALFREKGWRSVPQILVGGEHIGGFEQLKEIWEIVPQFIQVEAHPYFTQQDLLSELDEFDMKLMAWYPLGHGDKSLIEEPIFVQLAEKYGKSPAQIILRWHTQMSFVAIPGSKNIEHIKDNLDIFDFKLTNDEMSQIAQLDKGKRYHRRTEEALERYAATAPVYED